MARTNRLHDLPPRNEASEMLHFDSLMAASGLSAPTRDLDERTVLTALDEHFRLTGRLTRIPTEKDETFVLHTDHERLLVKVSGEQEAPSIVNLQTSALLHIAQSAPNLPIPSVQRGTDGRYEYDLAGPGGPGARVLRVMKFLPGSALSSNHPTKEQIATVGRTHAAITDALADFSHPQQARILVWDLRYFMSLRPLLEQINQPEDRKLGEQIFDAFAHHVGSRIPQLRHQVVHGDFSAHNVLVDDNQPEYVSGIIDFGDTTDTAEIFDVAIAMSNQLDAHADDPWHRALDMLSGYLAGRTPDANELSLLPIATASRSLQRVLIAQWRAYRDPSRADYVLSHAAHDWAVIRSIPGPTWTEVVDRIHSINASSSTR
ncbi:phosphotransferase [Rhodococcus sp. NPDC059968]|uniref:phosphotransferase n=1 Tax=Rhodococcus sp. NPDC059968 TaxID=3347017 RepID=UPI00366E7DB1